ncbi:MAG: hypothetical protein QOC62_3552 [Mycobacterium sp.]|jgi:hypothetical protein|nr:hypothetical protein [Mycobacterium sp.]
MLAVRDHRADDYAALKDMDLTDVGILDDSDRACLREIGEYLTTADAWRRFAIWLLHKHFEPLAGEIFVERAMPRTGTTETTPMQRSDFAFDSLSASAIRFGDDIDTDLYLVGLEFSELSSFGDVAPLSADDKAVLVGIAQRLRSHGKIDRFGVKLIRNPLGLSEGQLLLETCDPATRTQYCEIGSHEALPNDRSIIETTWRWQLTYGTSHPVVMQQCTAGCTPAAVEGHVLAHDQSGFNTDDEV